MGISKRARLWTGVSTAVLLGAGCGPVAETPQEPPAAEQTEANPAPESAAPAPEAQAPAAPEMPTYRSSDQGGEGGESGSGGERGIDAAAAASDPVPFLVALEVIRAHYLAGVAAYEAGKTAAGAEMFAQPISEVYVDLAPVFADRGVEPFDDLMFKAVDLASAGAPAEEVMAAVEAVMTVVDAAEGKAPDSTASPAHIQGAVIADFAERTALQYQFVKSGAPDVAWIDGYGYLHALLRCAERGLGIIEAADPDAAATVTKSLAVLKETFPEITPPESGGPKPGAALAASSSIAFAVASL